MIPVSFLDLVPVREGEGAAQAMAQVADLARAAESAGYARFWVAEHHGMAGIVGGATSVVLAHIGSVTQTIRIGAGGIMLPNHNPLVIAEQFGTLDALFPGRVDLGLGRAPGADRKIAYALRKDLMRAANDFPGDVMELMAQFAGGPVPEVQAAAAVGAPVQMWMLGSSLFGAQLAAELGLPYAFASHFAPAYLDQALALYRQRFQPSVMLKKPQVMVAMNVIVADSDEEAEFLASSGDQSIVALRHGTPGKLRPPVAGYRQSLPESSLMMIHQMGSASAIGDSETVTRAIEQFLSRTRADELIVTNSIWDPEIRVQSLQKAMAVVRSLPA